MNYDESKMRKNGIYYFFAQGFRETWDIFWGFRKGKKVEKRCSRGTVVQYGCKAAADLVQLLQISKAGDSLPVLVYRTKLLTGHF